MKNKQRDFTEKKTRTFKKISDLLIDGFTSKEIAKKINKSESTVNAYVNTMMIMYNCANRTQLAVKIATGGTNG